MNEFIEKLIGRLQGREQYYHECALDEIMQNGHTLDAEGFLGKEDAYGDATLNNMKKADLIKLLHTAQHNYETIMWFYNNAVKVNMSQLNNNGWIPCSERLPDKELIYVIGCFKDGNVSLLLYQGGGTFENDYGTGLYNTKQVIAWQPLPEPYIEEK